MNRLMTSAVALLVTASGLAITPGNAQAVTETTQTLGQMRCTINGFTVAADITIAFTSTYQRIIHMKYNTSPGFTAHRVQIDRSKSLPFTTYYHDVELGGSKDTLYDVAKSFDIPIAGSSYSTEDIYQMTVWAGNPVKSCNSNRISGPEFTP